MVFMLKHCKKTAGIGKVFSFSTLNGIALMWRNVRLCWHGLLEATDTGSSTFSVPGKGEIEDAFFGCS